jgi:hypothetical protein
MLLLDLKSSSSSAATFVDTTAILSHPLLFFFPQHTYTLPEVIAVFFINKNKK